MACGKPFRYRAQPLVWLALLVCCSGCFRYPELSERGYEVTRALYSVCARQDAGQLDQAESIIESAFTEGAINEREKGDFLEIVDSARQGQWQQAQTTLRDMLSDQTDW